jgi:hypothetical protein
VQLEQVRTYVLASLVCSVVMLHSLAIAALGCASNGHGGSRQGLFVLSILFGCLAIGAVRLINRLPLLTPWFLCAPIIPTAAYLVWFQALGH